MGDKTLIMVIDVVILTNSSKEVCEITKRTITSLHDSETNFKFKVHLIDSNEYSSKDYEKIVYRYDFINEPFNYNRFLNYAFRNVSSDWIIISNNDIGYERGWFSEIMEIHKLRPDIHSFSPKDPLLYMKYFSNHFIGGKDLYYESYKVSEAVMGWCLVIKRESLNKLLPFDEIFDMYYQDNDYAENLKKNGIRHALARHSIACHLNTLNIGKSNENIKGKMKEDEIKFRSKWKV